MGADRDNPQLGQLIKKIADNEIARRQRSFAAIVVGTEANGRVTVQPALRIAQRNGKQIDAKPVTIPVAWPSWGPYVMQGALGDGDEVMVICQDGNWLPWLEQGGVVDATGGPGGRAGYAYAEPRMVSTPSRPGELGVGVVLRIGRKDGLTTVELGADGSIKLAATDVFLTAGDGLSDFLTVLHAAIAAWVPVNFDGGAALKTALAAWLLKLPPTGGAPPPPPPP